MAASNGISKAGTLFFSSLCASTFGLGCWQAQRYAEKIEQVEKRQNELAQPPIELEKDAKCSLEDQTLGEEAEQKLVHSEEIYRGHRPIAITGKFRHQDEVLIGPRGPPLGALSATGPNSGRSSGGMASSPQGFYCLVPFERSNDMGTVIVNRGWIPRSYIQQNAAWRKPTETVTLVGIASKTETPKLMSPPHNEKRPRQLLWFDRLAIETKTGTKNSSPLLVTETRDSSGGDEGNAEGPPFKPTKESVGEFKVTPATHAGYAVTWFGLSTAGMIMTRKLITRGRK